ncbi:MAG: flagellar hook-length control protein FliK [Sideroxyarcus sp.]|nr:flagellar hook-length control protein FliK [Sideroxyarcus sp.]
MTNLPITASTAQTAAPGKQSANANDNADATTQPFGEVLARQIATPEVKVAKKDDKLAVDLAAQISGETTDIKKDDKAAAEVASTLPADMLAALLPQAMNTTVAAPAGTKTDADTTAALQGRIGVAARKADSAAGVQTEVTSKAAPLAAAEPQLKEQSFAATLASSAARTATSTEALAVAREASAAATVAAAASVAAQQPNTTAMATIQNAAGIAAPVVQAATLTVSTPVNQARWGDEFSQKITWLASSKMDQSAELHLNPPQLGPLDVVLKVSGDQATALFTSPHAAVREAIEQALPRLRDMLADNGITLGNATVSDQAPREQNKSDAQRTAGNTDNELRDTAAGGNNAARVSPISRHNGIVDTFA